MPSGLASKGGTARFWKAPGPIEAQRGQQTPLSEIPRARQSLAFAQVVRKPLSKGTKREQHTVPALLRAMELLEVIAVADEKHCSTKALAIELGIPRTTCYRILRSFASRNWVEINNDGTFRLASGLSPLIERTRRNERVGDLLAPVLASMYDDTRLTNKASMRHGDYGVTVAGCKPGNNSIEPEAAECFHLTLGSSGAALLSGAEKNEVSNILSRAPSGCWRKQKPQHVRARVNHMKAHGWCVYCGDNGDVWDASMRVEVPERDLTFALTVEGVPDKLGPRALPALLETMQRFADQARSALLQRFLPQRI